MTDLYHRTLAHWRKPAGEGPTISRDEVLRGAVNELVILRHLIEEQDWKLLGEQRENFVYTLTNIITELRSPQR